MAAATAIVKPFPLPMSLMRIPTTLRFGAKLLALVAYGCAAPRTTPLAAPASPPAPASAPCTCDSEAPAAAPAQTAATSSDHGGRVAPRQKSPRSETELLRDFEGAPAAQVLQGKATYYSNSLSGRKTASGEVYDPKKFTAAHKTLPFGTVCRVVRTDTNRYVYVTITDRGPFAGRERIIDLSYVAAERLGMLRAGVVPVRVEVLH